MATRRVRRGRSVNSQKREEAAERAKNYKPSKDAYGGMRERVKKGAMSIDEALDIITNNNQILHKDVSSIDFLNWLRRKKASNFRPADRVKKTKKTRKGKKRRAKL